MTVIVRRLITARRENRSDRQEVIPETTILAIPAITQAITQMAIPEVLPAIIAVIRRHPAGHRPLVLHRGRLPHRHPIHPEVDRPITAPAAGIGSV